MGKIVPSGMGITEKTYKELMIAGVNVITMGNHTWGKKEIFNIIDKENLIRPANYPEGVVRKWIWNIYI